MRLLCLSLLLLILPGAAAARNVEPGTFIGTAFIGPSIRLGSTLGGSRGYLALGAQGEYSLDKSLSALGDVSLGLAGTIPLRLHAGVRYRLTDLGLPISPYVQGQLAYGKLYDVLGANLTFLGLRAGAGADYFLTADMATGVLLALDFGGTLGARPAFYGTVDALVYASCAF
jgi:hypothetical protein